MTHPNCEGCGLWFAVCEKRWCKACYYEACNQGGCDVCGDPSIWGGLCGSCQEDREPSRYKYRF